MSFGAEESDVICNKRRINELIYVERTNKTNSIDSRGGGGTIINSLRKRYRRGRIKGRDKCLI